MRTLREFLSSARSFVRDHEKLVIALSLVLIISSGATAQRFISTDVSESSAIWQICTIDGKSQLCNCDGVWCYDINGESLGPDRFNPNLYENYEECVQYYTTDVCGAHFDDPNDDPNPDSGGSTGDCPAEFGDCSGGGGGGTGGNDPGGFAGGDTPPTPNAPPAVGATTGNESGFDWYLWRAFDDYGGCDSPLNDFGGVLDRYENIGNRLGLDNKTGRPIHLQLFSAHSPKAGLCNWRDSSWTYEDIYELSGYGSNRPTDWDAGSNHRLVMTYNKKYTCGSIFLQGTWNYEDGSIVQNDQGNAGFWVPLTYSKSCTGGSGGGGGGGSGGGGSGTLPQLSQLRAVCEGGNSPRVKLNWNIPTNTKLNVLRKLQGSGSFQSPMVNQLAVPFNITSYTDSNVTLGQTYTYQHKVDPNVQTQKTVTVTVDACQGQEQTSPAPLPTPTPSPRITLGCIPTSRITTPNQPVTFLAVDASGTGSYTWSAPGGTPSTGSGPSFEVRYPSFRNFICPQSSELLSFIEPEIIQKTCIDQREVTIRKDSEQASCVVMLYPTPPTVPTPGVNPSSTPTPTVAPNVGCVAFPSVANINQVISVFATGGNGLYSWSAPGASATGGNGSTFSTSYANANPSSRLISVTSAGQTSQCSVTIQAQPLTCVPTFQRLPSQTLVQTSATGGTGSYTWSAPGGTPTGGSGSSFGTTYSSNNPSTRSITVSDGSQTATCAVELIPGTSPTPLVCSPGNQAVGVNQNAHFVVNGGTGSYTWSAPGGTPTGGSGTSFAARFDSTGNRSVVVTSGTQTATCAVSVSNSPSPGFLNCSPTTQIVRRGQPGALVATGGTGSYTWSAPGGTPSIGSGATFASTYSTLGTRQVTLTDGTNSRTCTLQIESESALACVPLAQTLPSDQNARFVATGGTGSYTWSAPGGTPTGGSGTSFEVRYPNAGNRVVTLSSGSGSVTCSVTTLAVTPQPSVFPSPSVPPNTAIVNLSKLLRALEGTQELDSVSVTPSSTVEVILKVSSLGSIAVRNARVSDTLPTTLVYIPGSTTLDGVTQSDGVTSDGLIFPELLPGRVATVIFRVRIAGPSAFELGSSSITNTASVTTSNTPVVSDTAFIRVDRFSTEPLRVEKLGRNLTRGETEFQMRVNASPRDVVEFAIRARLLSGQPLSNVLVTDALPRGLEYIPGSTTINGTAVADGITAGGVSVGTLSTGQESEIRFSARVLSGDQLSLGTNAILNTVQVRSDSTTLIIAQLAIAVFNGTISGVSTVPTGAVGGLMLAFLLSLAVTAGYVVYVKWGSIKTFFAQRFGKKVSSEMAQLDPRSGAAVVAVALFMILVSLSASSPTPVAELGTIRADDATSASCYEDSLHGGITCLSSQQP